MTDEELKSGTVTHQELMDYLAGFILERLIAGGLRESMHEVIRVSRLWTPPTPFGDRR